MALPKKKKKLVSDVDINAAVQKAAQAEQSRPSIMPEQKTSSAVVAASRKKLGRPSLRSGKTDRMCIILNEQTTERLTIAYATEQVRRKKSGEKVDKSLLIEEAIVQWLDKNGF